MSKNNASMPVVPKPRVGDYLQAAVWSAEDGRYVGSVPPLVGPSYDGPKPLHDVAEFFHELDTMTKEYLDIFEEDGRQAPLPAEADALGMSYLNSPGDHILRCRLLDGSQSLLSDGAFQNQGGAHRPCFMPLPRVASSDFANYPSARYLRFSKTLIVPITGLRPLSSGSLEVLGYLIDEHEPLSSSGGSADKALHLI